MLHVTPFLFHGKVNRMMSHIDPKFDVLFLGMTPIKLTHINKSEGLHRVHRALGMPAYIINKGYFSAMIKIFKEAQNTDVPHDLVTQKYQPVSKWYGFFPAIARQRPSYSDIENKFTNYEKLDVKGIMTNVIG